MATSIAVHSFKGGTGKSTITANVGVALAMKGWRVGVMDMDLEGPGLHVFFNISPNMVKYTLNDVLLDAASPGQAALKLNESLGLSNGELYFSPASTNVTDMLRTLRTGFEIGSFTKALKSLQDLFELDYLLIDTHPGIENDTLLAVGVCDHLLIVSRIDQQDIFGTNVMVELARSLEKPAHLVFNMIPRGVREAEASRFARKVGANLRVEVLGVLPFSDDVQGSLSKSVFVLSVPNHQMTERFRELAKSIEGFRTSKKNTDALGSEHSTSHPSRLNN